MRIQIHILFFILTVLSAQAQEALRPLRGNPLLFRHPAEIQESARVKETHAFERKAKVSLQLPFVDDFYYSTVNPYPASHLWEDSLVYISSGYGMAPPSIGVATFDGLDRNGYPHDPTLLNTNKSDPADTLTSRPIDLHVIAASSKTLQPTDSVALLFFYQARGYGDNPESTDSLIVDLYKPRQNKWTSRVWFHRGNSSADTQDSVFYRALVRIADTAYFHDGFRFRFRNRATTSGDFDHWHVDYVVLDKEIYSGPKVFDDLTFSHVPSSYLKDYSAMPWKQYNVQEMAPNIAVRIRNNSSAVLAMSYRHDVYDAFTRQLLHSYDGGPVNLPSFESSGYSKQLPHSHPAITANYAFAPLTQARDLMIKHYVFRAGTNDFIPQNDTVIQFQRFRNYYAFDDGNAEAGYFIEGAGGTMAVKIRLNNPDTLRAIRIYFDPTGNVNSGFTFRMNIWADGGNGPGASLYATKEMTVQYLRTGFRSIPEYTLPAPVTLGAGTYYIGVAQLAAEGIPIGFDRNYDFRKNTYYNSGGGWKQSEIRGALMMHPVFGTYEAPVGLAEDHAQTGHLVYPNPAADAFTISCPDANSYSWRLLNAMGQIVAGSSQSSGSVEVSTRALPDGIYFLTLISGDRSTVKKIIVRH